MLCLISPDEMLGFTFGSSFEGKAYMGTSFYKESVKDWLVRRIVSRKTR